MRILDLVRLQYAQRKRYQYQQENILLEFLHGADNILECILLDRDYWNKKLSLFLKFKFKVSSGGGEEKEREKEKGCLL